jgi:hypothetical protein
MRYGVWGTGTNLTPNPSPEREGLLKRLPPEGLGVGNSPFEGG